MLELCDVVMRLTPAARNLAERRALQVFHPQWNWLTGGVAHAAATKRVSFNVRMRIQTSIQFWR